MEVLLTKLKSLRKTKYNWEFSGSSEERMKWLDEEIEKVEKEIEATKV